MTVTAASAAVQNSAYRPPRWRSFPRIPTARVTRVVLPPGVVVFDWPFAPLYGESTPSEPHVSLSNITVTGCLTNP